MSLSLTNKRRRDAEWMLDWSRNVKSYACSYTSYEAHRLKYGDPPPKKGSAA